VDRELRDEALVELCSLVEDWKNHEVGQFGDLLLHGQFTVVTGKTDVEKDVRDFLALIVARDILVLKQKILSAIPIAQSRMDSFDAGSGTIVSCSF